MEKECRGKLNKMKSITFLILVFLSCIPNVRNEIECSSHYLCINGIYYEKGGDFFVVWIFNKDSTFAIDFYSSFSDIVRTDGLKGHWTICDSTLILTDNTLKKIRLTLYRADSAVVQLNFKDEKHYLEKMDENHHMYKYVKENLNGKNEIR